MSAPLAAELRTKYSVRPRLPALAAAAEQCISLRIAQRGVHKRAGSRCACEEGRRGKRCAGNVQGAYAVCSLVSSCGACSAARCTCVC